MKQSIRKPTFRSSLQPDGTLELLVYEEIGQNYWTGGGVTAKTVKQQLDQAGPYSRLAVRVNSPGGDAFEGIAIHNLLRAQGKPIDVFVDGIAASAASVVAMAGDTRTMGSGSMMMIHNAWSSCVGYADDMRQMADTLDKVSGAVAETYVKRAGLSEDDAHALMDAESWLSAQECLENGLATAVAEDDENDDAAMALARSFRSLARLKKLPEKLRADSADGDDACQCYCAPCQDDRCNECECRGCDAENCGANSCNCAGAVDNKSDKDTKKVDGKECTKACFAYRPNDKKENWKLPIECPDHDATWEKDHIRNAISRWSSTDMPDAAEKDKARDRIKAAAKEYGIDVDEGSLDQADLSALEAELQLIELGAR